MLDQDTHNLVRFSSHLFLDGHNSVQLWASFEGTDVHITMYLLYVGLAKREELRL